MDPATTQGKSLHLPSPWKTWTFPSGRMTMTGHSRAAERTWFYIPELRWYLDVGDVHELCDNPRAVLVSHGHSDHSLCLTQTLSRKESRTVFLPAPLLPAMQKYIQQSVHVFDSVPEGEEPERPKLIDYVPAVPGQDVRYVNKGANGKGTEYNLHFVACDHSVPSVGYCVSEVRSKLKAEYQELAAKGGGKAIGELRKQGVEVSEEALVPLFAFMGDTTVEVFKTYPEVLTFPVVITECTFILPDEREHAPDRKHTHWEDLKPVVQAHPAVTFVLIHFSLRYKVEDIRDFFAREQADGTCPNVVVWLDEVCFFGR